MSSSGPGTRVLLVDDDAEVCRLLSRVLQTAGHDVRVETNGLTALAALEDTCFDVILSDISMTPVSGLEFLRRVRERDLDVPVILITGRPDVETAMAAVEYGAFGYLPKPVQTQQLTASVQRAVHVHELTRLRREALSLSGQAGIPLGDRVSIEARLGKALDKLYVAFQPIVHTAGRQVFGYEALVRSEEASLASPYALFDAAERLGQLQRLGRSIRAKVAEAAPHAPANALLFVNVHAEELNDEELYGGDAPLSPFASRIVLEITERTKLDDVPRLSEKLSRLRRLGYRLAVDDLGSGYAGLSSITLIEPDFVKLDMSFVKDVHESSRKRALLRSLVRVCSKDLEMQVICEGVELAEQRDVLGAEAVDLMQGYLFARPQRGFVQPERF